VTDERNNPFLPERFSTKLMRQPIIKLEVGFMKSTMVRHLSDETAKVDSMVAKAVEAYCSDENLQHVIDEEVKLALNAAVREEIRDFFSSTRSGRQAVREMVVRHLDAKARLYGDDQEEITNA
jgi:predicted metalloprotease